MYCVNCGVKLAPTESVCPLCGTRVYHPDLVGYGISRRLYGITALPCMESRPCRVYAPCELAAVASAFHASFALAKCSRSNRRVAR